MNASISQISCFSICSNLNRIGNIIKYKTPLKSSLLHLASTDSCSSHFDRLPSYLGSMNSSKNYSIHYRSEPFAYKRCNNQSANNFYPPPPPIGFVYHHSSFDELSRTKPNRNMHCPNVNVNFVDPPLKTQPEQQQYQWPKVIPKSPSSFSMNSFRLQRQPPFSKCPNHKPIDEFDLDKIEHDCRKSNTTLFNESVRSTDFGTAV